MILSKFVDEMNCEFQLDLKQDNLKESNHDLNVIRIQYDKYINLQEEIFHKLDVLNKRILDMEKNVA